MVVRTERGSGQRQPPAALHIDPVVAVDHDLGDQGIVEEPLEGPEAKDFVHDFADHAAPFLGRQRDLFVIHEGAESLTHHPPQIFLVEAVVGDPAAQTDCQFFGCPLLDAREGIRGRGWAALAN